MEQKKRVVIFKVNEINGYELIVERKETFDGLEMKPEIVKMHYVYLIKELQDVISKKENIAKLEGIERGDEILELLYQRKELMRKIADVAFELLTNVENKMPKKEERKWLV